MGSQVVVISNATNVMKFIRGVYHLYQVYRKNNWDTNIMKMQTYVLFNPVKKVML